MPHASLKKPGPGRILGGTQVALCLPGLFQYTSKLHMAPVQTLLLTSVQTDSKFLKYSFRNGLSCCVPGSQAYLHPGRFRPAMHKPREGGRGRASCHWRTICRKSQVIHYKTAVTDQEGVSFVSLPY